MALNDLFQALAQRDPAEAERAFAREAALHTPDPTVELARVKRVALFAEAFLPKIDGVSKTAYLTLRYLRDTGREVIVFAPDIAPHQVAGSEVIPLPSIGFPVAPESRLAIPHPLVAQKLHEFQPDLIHLFSPALLSVSGMLVGRQMHIPVIANYQTDLPGYAEVYGVSFLSGIVSDWLRFIHNGCHLTLVPSNWTLRELRRNKYHRLRRWGRGVNGEQFNPARRSAAWRARLLNGRDPNSLLCIYVGRLANEKRIDLLLETARTPGVALTIIGDGALREELEARFDGTGTHFTGYLFGEDLANAYAAADVFMFTGAKETFGQVVQEAQASGLPAVIIDQGGVTDLVQDGVTGFICPGNPFDFADAVIRLRDDRDLLARLSAQARAAVERNSWDAVMVQLEGYYREAVALNDRLNRVPLPPRWGLNLLSWRPQDLFQTFLPRN
ncbi:MAG: glycosyltransferase family 1 protein [Anaerolineae bacterium]|nr:glycosyltransferase family 1 protein [Anaerolineae bacterium]NUQ07080.1 glycosyltransferase family 1 protein [Anaerolineae bacterium]